MASKIILRLAISLIILGLCSIVFSIIYLPKITIEDLYKLGGFIGGVIGPTWSIASVLLFLYTIISQREQIGKIREESEQNKKYIETQINIQNKILQLNEFEKKYNALNDTIINYLNNFEFDGLKGDAFFKSFVNKIKEQEHLVIDSLDINEIIKTKALLKAHNIDLNNVEESSYPSIIEDIDNIGFGYDGSNNEFNIYLTKVSSLFRWGLIDSYVLMLEEIDESSRIYFRRKLFYMLTNDQREFIYNCFLKAKQSNKNDNILKLYDIERIKTFIKDSLDNVQYPLFVINKENNIVPNKYTLEYYVNDDFNPPRFNYFDKLHYQVFVCSMMKLSDIQTLNPTFRNF